MRAGLTVLALAASCAGGDRNEPDASTSQADATAERDSSVQFGDATGCAGFERQGHCYILYETAQNIPWTAAKAQCETTGTGGYLVTYDSADENEAVISAQKPTKRAWIGLSDRTVEGTFAWVTGEPFSYTNWRLPGEPSNGGATGNEDCGSQSIEVDNWRWNDLDCAGGAAGTLAYICEFP